ncbi:hypothetical protein BGX38DRAFT_1146347 [Terfezia claveryi]|nr:hypothetical protein BGX38DRAFT_1146347 [Terfezia claveryi]
MSIVAIMPISTDTLHYRTILFELSKPVPISPQIFNEIWLYVDSVYSKLQQELLQAYGIVHVQKYEYRLPKTMNSTIALVLDTDGNFIKCQQSSIQNANLCNIQIKVSSPVDGIAVMVEHFDEHTHTHDIEESFWIKKPSILVGAGKYEGSEWLKELDGSSLKTFIRLYSGEESKARIGVSRPMSTSIWQAV